MVLTSVESITTPPLPSSSPGQLNERMDISPLPHKQPFSYAQIEVHSPTPVPTPEEDIMRSSPPRPAFMETSRPNGAEYEITCIPNSTFANYI
jgi:M-phase inducer tyrosine phosphatase